jgi:hypothetical protein
MHRQFVNHAFCVVVAVLVIADRGSLSHDAIASPVRPIDGQMSLASQTSATPTPPASACVDASTFEKVIRELMFNFVVNSNQSVDWQLKRNGNVLAYGESFVDSTPSNGLLLAIADKKANENGSAQTEEDENDGTIDLSTPPTDGDENDGTVDFSTLPATSGQGSARPKGSNSTTSRPGIVVSQKKRRCCMYTAKAEAHNPNVPNGHNFIDYPRNFHWNENYGCDRVIHCETKSIPSVNLSQVLAPGARPTHPAAGVTGIDFGKCQTVWPVAQQPQHFQTLEQVIKQEQCDNPSLVSLRHGEKSNGQYCTTAFCRLILPLLQRGARAELIELTCHTATDPVLRCGLASLAVEMFRSQCQGSGSSLMTTAIYGEMMLPYGGKGCSIADPTGIAAGDNVNQLVRTVVDETGFIMCRLTANGWQEYPDYCGQRYRNNGDLTGVPKPKNSKLKCS